MRIVLSLVTLIVCLLLTGFVYQQIMVEGDFGPAAIVGTTLLGFSTLTAAFLTYLSGTRHRESVRNLLLAVSVSAATFLLVDFALGKILIVPLSPPLVPDEYRHHALEPDSYAELRQPDFHYIQRVNSLGLRGQETTVEKPADTRRILMLGDSFTMGKGVEDDETFSVLVEAELSEQFAATDCGMLEVINGGTDSYSPILSAIQLERDLIEFSPDLVVLNLDNSDLIQEQAYRQQAIRDENGRIVAVPQAQDSKYEQFLSWVTRNFYLTRIAMVHIIRTMDHKTITVRRVVNEFGREVFAHTLEADKTDRTGQWRDIFESINRIKLLAEKQGAAFILTTYPWAHQVNDTDWIPGRYRLMEEGEKTNHATRDTIREYTDKLGMTLYEARPSFLKYQGGEAMYFKSDPHWTALGHRVMAQGLSARLSAQWLESWCE